MFYAYPKVIARALINKGIITDEDLFKAYKDIAKEELDIKKREEERNKNKPWYKKVLGI